MSWALAFCIIGVSFFILAFALFIIVYLKELAREKEIIGQYSKSMLEMPMYILDKPLKTPTETMSFAPVASKDKKIIN